MQGTVRVTSFPFQRFGMSYGVAFQDLPLCRRPPELVDPGRWVHVLVKIFSVEDVLGDPSIEVMSEDQGTT